MQLSCIGPVHVMPCSTFAGPQLDNRQQLLLLSTSTSSLLSCKTGDVLATWCENKKPNGNAGSCPRRTAAPRRPPTKVRRLPARLVLHVSSDATVIYNRKPLGKASPLLTSSQAVCTLFRSLFRNAANDPQHGNSFSFLFFLILYLHSCCRDLSVFTSLAGYCCGVLVDSVITLGWESGKGWRGREESQTKHESEGVSRSACERSGGLWERASLEKCPRGEN